MNQIVRAILVLILLVILVMIPNIKILAKNHAMVIERFGKFDRIIDQAGIYILIPLYERAIETVSLDPIKSHLSLDDDIKIDYIYQIVDIKTFVYQALDSIHAFHEELINHSIHDNVIDLMDNMNDIAQHYGFKVNQCKINNQK